MKLRWAFCKKSVGGYVFSSEYRSPNIVPVDHKACELRRRFSQTKMVRQRLDGHTDRPIQKGKEQKVCSNHRSAEVPKCTQALATNPFILPSSASCEWIILALDFDLWAVGSSLRIIICLTLKKIPVCRKVGFFPLPAHRNSYVLPLSLSFQTVLIPLTTLWVS